MNKTMLLSLFKSSDCSRLSLLGRFFSSDASLWGGEPGLSSAWPVAVVARKRMTNVKHSHPLASLIKLVGCL